MDEQELRARAKAVQEGDPRAFRVLVDTLSRTLMAMAYRYTSDWEWARDLTQETWMKVHQGIGQYRPDRSFSSWLFAIHRNVCLDHVRRAWVRREVTTGDEMVVRLTGASPDDPALELERQEFRQRVLAAANQLSDTQRKIFARVDLEQGDQKEVARELGIRPGTVRAALHHARKRIAATLVEMEQRT